MNNEQIFSRWSGHPFFAPDAIVLGLDIGIEGIGITVRKGKEWLYSRTLIVDLPEAKALASRRQMRAARHARKNRRTRMSRLKKLFAKHGLPWVSDDVASRSDPFVLRWRAINKKLASREALSLCIRSCVMLRGYDYFAMSQEKGAFPWGDDNKLADARKWLSSQFLDVDMANHLRMLTPELRSGRDDELKEEEIEIWENLINERLKAGEEAGIEKMLSDYKTKELNARRARGFNFPRSHVKRHLCTILERHKDLIDDYDGFVKALFHPCDTLENKKKAIFYYNRKTPQEATEHYEGKVKDCPFVSSDIVKIAAGTKCGLRGEPEIRRWNLVNFLSNHRFILKSGKLPEEKQLLPHVGIKVLADYVMREARPSWKDAKKELEEAIKPLKFATGNDWNTAQLDHLKDIVAPAVNIRKGRANISVAAAKELYSLATNCGENFEPMAIEAWKKESGYYDELKRIDNGGLGLYPQVQVLLGTLRKQRPKMHVKENEDPNFATIGLLQRIFEKEIADKLDGKITPDYCIIECIKDPARNDDQKKEIEKMQKANRAQREKLLKKYGLDQQGNSISHAQALRIRLFEEQGGSPSTPALCPFTGQPLGTDPLSDKLELAHLFPDSRGGLYIAENLVLTTRQINDEMDDRTPKEAAAANLPGWLSWNEMLKKSQKFSWNKMKRSLFAFPDEEAEGASTTFPDFNNITRTAQLARELRRLAAVWMGIEKDPEAMRQRIGNISGVYTAAARKTIFGDNFVKDRTDNNHHRMDAAVMTCIPPAEGLNDVKYGGVFYTDKKHPRKPQEGEKPTTYPAFRMINVSNLPLPDFNKLTELDKEMPPVIKLRSTSKTKPLGDGTFWRVEADGSTSQRTPINPGESPQKIYDNLVKATNFASELHSDLSSQIIPSLKVIEKWCNDNQPATKDDSLTVKPLRLTNGTPVKSMRKYDSKGKFQSPIGWSAVVQEGQRISQVRSLDEKNDRMEIWLGWNSKKKRWEYYRHLIPSKSVLNGLKRMGIPWRGTKGAPEFLLDLLKKEKAKDLRSLVCGILPPRAVKVGVIRKGDMFRRVFAVNSKAVEKLRQKNSRLTSDDFPQEVECWGAVSAIKSNGEIQISCVDRKDRKVARPIKVDDISGLLGLPMADEQAQVLSLQPPV